MSDIIVTTGGNSVTNGTNFQTALNSAVAGDRVILTAGATYDGSFTLADKSASSGSPVTITTDMAASLPNRRIDPGDVSLMAKVRTLGGGAVGEVFHFSANASWWIIDGLEITDAAADTIVINSLVYADLASVHDIVIKRCWFHNQETGTDYYRSIRWAVQWEAVTLLFKWNYVKLLGYYQLAMGAGTFTPLDTMAIGCVGGKDFEMNDNYVSVWYAGFFTGGGDTDPQNTATVTSSSTTSGTFSNVTGLAAGVVIRFDFLVNGTFSSTGPTVTRTSGATMTSSDIGRFGRITEVGGGGATGVYELTGVSGSVYTFSLAAGGNPPNGSVTLVMYETARVDSVAGSVVNYTPFGLQSLVQAPPAASWNYGDQGLINDIDILFNTFELDVDFAVDVRTNNSNFPKGWMECKNVKRLLVEGNIYIGHPSVMAFTGASQNRTAPWITNQDVTIRNNWIHPDYFGPGEGNGHALIITDNQYIATNTPSKNFSISNNLLVNVHNLMDGGGGGISAGDEIDNVEIFHNTCLNNVVGSGYNSITGATGKFTTFSFHDNIVSYKSYGMQCFVDPFMLGTCWPSGSFSKNVVADPDSAGFSSTVWGAGGILTPIPATFDDVGFVDAANDIYELDVSSDYKGLGTGGTDPGVDWDALLDAIGGAPQDPPNRKVKKGNITRGRH